MSQGGEAVDFGVLSSVKSTEFHNELKSSPYKLQKIEYSQYFKILLGHFQKQMHTKTGNSILNSIFKVLSDEDAINVFAENHYILDLPFSQKEYITEVLDILYVLVSQVPEIFDMEVATQISFLTQFEPRKCLVLIGVFAQSLSRVKEPFPMLDILFRQTEDFRSIECADDYIGIMVRLLQTSPEFRQQRIQHCWTYICDMLILQNVAIINACYYGLCAVAEVDKDAIADCGYPINALTRHIRRRPLQASSFSLLMRYPPPSDTRKMEDLLLALLAVAGEEERATLLLMGLSTDCMNALILLQNPQWMTRGLPKTLDTMRLFCIILLHKELRELIVDTPETIDFFRGLLSSNSVGMVNAICTMIRRLPLTPEFVGSLSDSGFLGAYFSSILENEEEDVMLSALRLLDTVARVRYVRELSDMIDTVISLIKKGGDLSKAAASVAIDLARYPKCAKLFRTKRLTDYYKQPLSDPKMKKYADKFLEIMRKVEERY